jgi:wyosine [tRNA(Phe)-imidazoG37] synthetase (radical SAM superfamily)
VAHVFGPVPSRRLGVSLGIDLVPFKTCSFDCIYCQLGATTCLTTGRSQYVRNDLVLDEVDRFLSENEEPDFITLSGSGEPTLNSGFPDVIRNIKRLTEVPVAVLTNSSLMWMKDVHRGLMYSDLVVPSLDAGSESIFREINRPHPSLSLDRIIRGITKFSTNFNGKIWMEIMLVNGKNDGDKELDLISQAINYIDPERVQLNTVVRPPSEEFARPIKRERMIEISNMLGAEIIADYKDRGREMGRDIEEKIISMLLRRPCTLQDISDIMGIHPNEALKHLTRLSDSGLVRSEKSGDNSFFVVADRYGLNGKKL